ncbi:MAG: helix-turn-helix transcriptional regulator [Bacteroidota bacterium]
MKNPHKINKTVSAKPESFLDNIELAPLTKRLERIAKKRGFQSYREYIDYYLLQRGLVSESEHQKQLAERMGLTTPIEYINKLNSIRAKNPKYVELANLINTRLSELHMNKYTLARRVRISNSLIYRYTQGYHYPKPKTLNKILEVLQIYHHSPLIGNSQILGKNVILQKPKHTKYSELSNLIENALAYSGKDRKWLAKTTKIPQRHITYYMNGLVYPSPARLQRIKNTLYSLTLKKKRKNSIPLLKSCLLN